MFLFVRILFGIVLSPLRSESVTHKGMPSGGQSPTKKKSLTLRSAQRDAFIATAEKEQTQTNTNNIKTKTMFIAVLVPNCI